MEGTDVRGVGSQLEPVAFTSPFDPFEGVLLEKGKTASDFWFHWPRDFEPVRQILRGAKVEMVLYRRHWLHHIMYSPYTNKKGRIEVAFVPLVHTPKIRKKLDDLTFYILVKSTTTMRHNRYVAKSGSPPSYYKSSGWKTRHPPPVNYRGWPALI